ncbi:MAG: L,D-transpeptidase family protein [Alphaproteobacteria bacterium]
MTVRFGLVLAAALAGFAGTGRAQPIADDLHGRLRVVSMSSERVADVSERNDLGRLQIVAANPGLDPFEPQTRAQIVLPTAHLLPDGPREGLVVNRGDYRLYYFVSGELAFTAPVGLGHRAHETPLGKTTVVRKAKDPTWYPTENARDDFPELSAVIPPGPDNPLGTRALYLGWPTYLIHGAVDSYAIGRRFTRGCIRLYSADIERLFEMVPVGTPVEIVDQPVKMGWHGGELFLEAHPSFEQLEELRVKATLTATDADYLNPLIKSRAGGRAPDIEWSLVAETLAARRGLPVQITSPKTHPVNIMADGTGY